MRSCRDNFSVFRHIGWFDNVPSSRAQCGGRPGGGFSEMSLKNSGRKSGVICRQIAAADADAVADLLAAGFPARPQSFWRQALRRLADHAAPPAFPKYGYLLADGDRLVGVLLMICTAPTDGTLVRCNVSSWYVEPLYRGFAALLVARAFSHKPAVFTNVTPAPNTLPLMDAQGYRVYCRGRLLAMPILNWRGERAQVSRVTARQPPPGGLTPADAKVLLDHAGFGCLCVVVTIGDHAFPFVFQRRAARRRPPHAMLVWCRSVGEFVTCAGPLGLFLAKRGIPFVLLDADGPIAGLHGRFAAAPKFFKGAEPPRHGDLAYSEYPVLGI